MRMILRRLLAGFALIVVAAVICGGYAYNVSRTSVPPVDAAADAPSAGPLLGLAKPRRALVLSSGGGRC